MDDKSNGNGTNQSDSTLFDIGYSVVDPPIKKGKSKVVGSIIAAVLIIIGVMFLLAFTGQKEYEKYDTVALNGANLIKINAAANIHVVEGDGQDIYVTIRGKGNIEPKYETEHNINKDKNRGSVSINFSTGINVGVVLFDYDMTVEVPAGYSGDINIETSSGNLEFDLAKLNDVTIKSSSGNIAVKSLSCDEFEAKASSGNINISRLAAKEANIKCTSGNINADKFTADEADFNCSSGNIVIDSLKITELSAKTSSGNITVNYDTFVNDEDVDIELHCSSGNIKLELPSDSEFKLDAKASSGKVRSEFDIVSGDSGVKDNRIEGKTSNQAKSQIEARTSSGDIHIKNK